MLGQEAVGGKGNEITVIPRLAKRLELTGAFVTIDATNGSGPRRKSLTALPEAGRSSRGAAYTRAAVIRSSIKAAAVLDVRLWSMPFRISIETLAWRRLRPPAPK